MNADPAALQTTESASRLLRAKINLVSARLEAASAALWDGPDFARLYPRYLCQVHAMLRASVPLMEAALRSARLRMRHDPVADRLAEYFETHVHEETGHDEWVLQDLGLLGVDRAAVLERIPSAAIATLVGSQYYWIHHDHPVALLGYIAVLEGSPPEMAHLEAVSRRTGLPLDAFRTMIKHARLDPQHRDDLDRLIDTLALSSRHVALIGLSAFHTVDALCDVIEETTTG